MCLIFLAIQSHPTYKLIIAANRDEFYNRKTAPADYWLDHPDILGGRDLEAQGTWLAMSRSGKISLLTNYRDPQNIDPHAPSRGHLVADYLENNIPPEDYLSGVEKKSHQYNGFNLVAGDVDELWFLSNYRPGIVKINAGLSGLSNHLLNTPWPKVERGKEKLKILLQNSALNPEILFEFLFDDQRASDAQLPDTGIGLERERALSSMFIKSPGYGSRCSTVVLVDKQNHVSFSERVYDTATFDHTTKNFEFDITEANDQ